MTNYNDRNDLEIKKFIQGNLPRWVITFSEILEIAKEQIKHENRMRNCSGDEKICLLT